MGFVDDVFHGSTHNIDDFSKARTLNPEGHFGAGHYFTSNADDASEHYAGLGPDLTSRIEQRMDAIDSELDGYELDDLLNAFPQMTNKEAKSISSGNSEVFDDFKRRVATKELAGDNSGAVYPIKLRSNKTYDLGTKEDTFMKYERDLPDRDDLADEIRDELDINDYDDKSDFDDAVEDLVDERYYDAMNYEEPQGELADFMLSLSNQADEYGFDASDLMSNINEAAMDSDGLTALELDDIMRTTEWYADNDQGKLINNEVYRKAIEDSGFDTIKHKGNIFNGMDVEDDTVHTIVFDPSNIRSKYAKFDPAKSSSSNILASNPAATAGAGILGLAAMAGSDDADAGVLGKAKGLLMDTPSRMARAKEQGFDVDTPVYHGTDKDIAEFNQPINWVSEDVRLADDYASMRGVKGGSNVMELVSKRPEKSFDMDLMNKNSTPQGLIAEMGRQSGFDKLPSKLQDDIYDDIDDLESHLSRTGIDNAVMKRHHLLNAEAVGGDTVEKFKTIASKMGFDSASLTEDGYKTVGYFNKPDVRSVNARFDPAKAGSSNLLASNPVATAGAGLLSMGNEIGQEPQGLLALSQGRDALLTPEESAYLKNKQEFDSNFSDDTGYDRADILPFRVNQTTGDSEFATPQMLKGLLEAFYDYGQIPKSGIFNPKSLEELI